MLRRERAPQPGTLQMILTKSNRESSAVLLRDFDAIEDAEAFLIGQISAGHCFDASGMIGVSPTPPANNDRREAFSKRFN